MKLKTIFCLVLTAALLCGMLAVTGLAAGADDDALGVTVDNCSSHTAAVLDGDLYVWGTNNSGQFPKNKYIASAEPLKVLNNVKDVAVARERTLVLLEDGTLYTYGIDPLTEQTQQAQKVMSGVAQMDCSENFALLVTNNGAVYAWGANEYGQLGTGDTESQSKPVCVIESGVTKVVTGANFSLALHKDGSVSAWGANDGCQLGYTESEDDVILEPVVVMESGVKDIDAGASYSCILKNDGTVWTCGHNELSQLGIGTLDDCVPFTKILTEIRSISAGSYYGFAVSQSGQIYHWGFGINGQLGTGNYEVSMAPETSEIGDFIRVFAGETSTFAVDHSGSIFAWGNNSEMQLAKENGIESVAPVMIINEQREWAFADEDLSGGVLPDGSTATGGSDSSADEEEDVENAILSFVSGYPDGTFRPDAQTTRAEFLTMLATALGDYDKTETYGTPTFDDVPADAWFANVVAYAQKTSLIKGYEDNTFRPDDNITRAEAAAMVSSAMGLSADATVSSFTDVEGWALAHIEALAKLGILSGDGDGTFRPNDNIIRSEAVTIVAHAIGFSADSEEVQTALKNVENPFADVPADSWAYPYVLRAAGLVE